LNSENAIWQSLKLSVTDPFDPIFKDSFFRERACQFSFSFRSPNQAVFHSPMWAFALLFTSIFSLSCSSKPKPISFPSNTINLNNSVESREYHQYYDSK
jgi:hypothetical protein